MVRRCSCPRVVRAYGVYMKDRSFLGLVMEYCEDGDLRQLLSRTEVDLSDEQKWRILLDIAEV